MSAMLAVQTVFQTLSRHDSSLAAYFMLEFRLEDGCSLERAIVLLNRYWRDYLGRLPNNTMDARTYLVDECTLPEWIRLFETGVLPVVLEVAYAS